MNVFLNDIKVEGENVNFMELKKHPLIAHSERQPMGNYIFNEVKNTVLHDLVSLLFRLQSSRPVFGSMTLPVRACKSNFTFIERKDD